MFSYSPRPKIRAGLEVGLTLGNPCGPGCIITPEENL